jgi:hypothetical protein
MDNILDIFKQDAFGMVTLTDYVNKQPFVPGRIGELGIFEPMGITTLQASIEEYGGKLSLLATAPRSGPATKYTPSKRKMRTFAVPHIPFDTHISADEIQNVRAFGTNDQLQGIQDVTNQRLMEMVRMHDATLEFHRIGAIKGTILDADGTTTIYNLFTEFAVSQASEVDFDLDNSSPASGAVMLKCNSVLRTMEDALELGAMQLNEVFALCGSTFFDQLVAHKEVRETFLYQQGERLRQRTARRSVFYGGIQFEEYRGTVGSTTFVDPLKAHFFPLGIPGLFKTYYAPANWMEAVNTVGLPRYAKVVLEDPAARYASVMTQQNPLNICTRPKVLIQGKNT